MKRLISGICVFFLLSLYLIVPFKSQFLDSLHIISHISLHQNPHHHHNHYFNDHDHHHGLLASISISIDDQKKSDPLPVNISEYKFELPFPVNSIRLTQEQSKIMIQKFCQQIVSVLNGPFFKVPTPPPQDFINILF